MVTVILLSFEYSHKKLHSSIFDLYIVYHHFLKLDYKIKIITDILNYVCFTGKESMIDIIEEYMNQFNDKPRLLEFFEMLCHEIDIKTYDIDCVKRIISDFLSVQNDDRYIFYYSGHGVKGNLLFPEKSRLPFSHLLQYFSSCLPRKSQAFIFLDCCATGELKMPFQYHPTHFEYNEQCYYYSQQMIVISSSRNEKSLSTKYGSFFTKAFFDSHTPYDFQSVLHLCKKKIFEKIKTLHGNDVPNLYIYTTHIIHPIFWSWIFIICTDIKSDTSLSTLYIKNNQNLIQSDVN